MVPTTMPDASSLPAVVAIPAGRREGDSTALIGTPATRTVEVDVDVVIPAFNESERLPNTLLRTAEYLGSVPWRSRIIVVDNGSVDDTAGVALRIARGQSVPIEVVGCARPGKGAAVRRGLLSLDPPSIFICPPR